MLLFLTIMQSTPIVETSPLRILLDLFISVTLVGLLIMILMASNYYIRKSSIISRRGDKWNPRHRTRSSDPAMQFEFMTREELKEMVLRERERKARTAESERISSESEQHEKPAHVETAGIEPQESEPRQVMAGAPETDAKAPVSEETVLMANLLMEDDESEKEPLPPRKRPPKGHKPESVIRGALSNELPEEFRGKSRRI